jgi:carbon monoxide dehydrogenase subunit G
MKIKGTETVISASAAEVFNFLAVPKNLEQLLPLDKITDFQADDEGCSFKVQGGILIPLIITNTIPAERIDMNDGDKGPFPYTLSIHIKAEGSNSCSGYIEFEGEVNMFMKMMVQKPLTSLFENMTKKLQLKFED